MNEDNTDTLTKKAVEKRVRGIAQYLGCNENELWSEIEKLFDAVVEDIKTRAEFEKDWAISDSTSELQ